MSIPIGIVACAWKIGDQRVANFVSWNRGVFESENVDLCIVSDRELDLEYGRTAVYPVEQEIFSIPKTINFGLRTFTEGIVAKTDIDIIWSKELIQRLREVIVAGETGYIGICANIGKPEGAKNYEKLTKRLRGRGACFALHIDDWHAICGYDERIQGWGGDDEDCWRRARTHVKMVEEWKCPLYHMRHAIRAGRETFPILSKRNMKISGKRNWSNQEWGKPQ